MSRRADLLTDARLSQPEQDDRMRPAFARRATVEQTKARRELVRDLIVAGMTRQLLARAIRERTTPAAGDAAAVARQKRELAAKIGAPLEDATVDVLCATVRKEMAVEFENDRPTARAVQLAQIDNELLKIRRDIEIAKPSVRERLYLAAARHEELRAKIAGTFSPSEHRVDVAAGARETLIAVIVNMSRREQDEVAAEQADVERLEGADSSVSSLRREETGDGD